jgi:hypothetical protein
LTSSLSLRSAHGFQATVGNLDGKVGSGAKWISSSGYKSEIYMESIKSEFKVDINKTIHF